MSARLTLVEPDAPFARSIARVLGAAGSVQIKDALGVLDRHGGDVGDLLIVDVDAIGPDAWAEPVLAQMGARGRLLCFTATTDRSVLATWLGERRLTNILGRAPDIDGGDLLVTAQKILRQDAFGIDKYFGWEAHRAAFSLRDGAERHTTVAAVVGFFRESDVAPRFIERIESAVDELVTNALYDAPTDSAGKPRFAHLHRTVDVGLDAHESIEIDVRFDGRRAGIAVRDPFGALSRETLLAYLSRCLRADTDQIENKPGGAGCGLYTTFEAVSHLVVNVAPRKTTELIGILDVRGPFRDFARQAKSLNAFISS